jgi:hypothetical protein
MLDGVIRETNAVGLFINVAISQPPVTITVNGAPIQRVEDFKYLGSYVGGPRH